MPKGLAVTGDYLFGSFCLGKTDNQPLRRRVQFPAHYCFLGEHGKKNGKLQPLLPTLSIEKRKDNEGKQFGEQQYKGGIIFQKFQNFA